MVQLLSTAILGQGGFSGDVKWTKIGTLVLLHHVRTISQKFAEIIFCLMFITRMLNSLLLFSNVRGNTCSCFLILALSWGKLPFASPFGIPHFKNLTSSNVSRHN